MFVDTHAHLNFEDLKNDLPGILERAYDNNVTKIIVPSLSLKSSREVLELCSVSQVLHCAVGIHPNELSDFQERDLYEIEGLCKNTDVVAVGEIGLDYHWKPFDKEKQKFILEAQLEIAKKKNLPVILHNREAFEDLLEIIRTKGAGLKGQFHAFSGDLQMAKNCTDLGFYLSFAGNITYKPNEDTLIAHQIIKEIGTEYLLLETDSPFLTPEPHRGKVNEPAFIKYTVEKIAELTDNSVREVGRVTSYNAVELYVLV